MSAITSAERPAAAVDERVTTASAVVRSDAAGVPAALLRPGLGPPVPREAAVRRRRVLPSPTLLSFLLVVVVPVALAAIYYLGIAADQYVVAFRFGVRSAQPARADGGVGLIPGATPLQVGLDSYAVAQYIDSRAIVDTLNKTIDLRRMFATPAADWPARLHLPASAEDLIEYWRGQVEAFFDPTNGTIRVRVRAFSADDALELARAVLAAAEQLVNDLSLRARHDALRNAEGDVAAAEARLRRALARLRDYRDRAGLIDPHKSADANAALSGRVRDEIVRTATTLATLQQYLAADAPALKLLEARLQSLKAQQTALEGEATVNPTTRNEALSRMLSSYEELESERQFAETAYQHALAALDRARANADRQQVYLADFIPPSRPEAARYPRRWRSLGIVFAAAFVVWAIGNLMVRSIRDHL